MIFFERHKPIITILIAIVLMIAIGAVFYVLHEHDEEEDLASVTRATESTLEDFSEVIKTGNIKLAKKHCSKEGANQLVLDSLNTEVFKKTLLEGLGITEDNLSDESKAYLSSLLETFQSKVVTDVTYDMSSLEVEKKTEEGFVVTLPVTITGCGSLNAIDFSPELSYATHSMLDYATMNQEALMNHNDAFGEEGVHELLAQQIYTNLFSAMTTKAAAYEPSARQYKVTLLVTKDAEGNYSSAQIVGAEEVLE